jgi:hypothetical protein
LDRADVYSISLVVGYRVLTLLNCPQLGRKSSFLENKLTRKIIFTMAAVNIYITGKVVI